MTSEDDVLRESLRDLIPDYRPPGDPFTRVSASVRRRRARRRALLAIGSAATVAAIATAVPTLVGLARPLSGQDTAGPAGSGRAQSPTPPAPSYLVREGIHGSALWRVFSSKLAKAQRCLVADDPVVFDKAAWCFDKWQPPPSGQSVTWGVVDEVRPDANVTAVFGVAGEFVTEVRVDLDDRADDLPVRTVPTETDPKVRFFAFVVERSGVHVDSMAGFADDGTWMGTYPEPAGGQSCAGAAEPTCAPSPP
jgi:hypothetical protein